MLDLVLDIKNNRKKQQGSEESFKYLSDGLGKWLQDCGVAKIKMGALSWEKLLMEDKKGALCEEHVCVFDESLTVVCTWLEITCV